MSGTSPETNHLGLQGLETVRNPKRHKCIKKIQDPVNLHLEEKTRLNGIVDVKEPLVDRFSSRRMKNGSLKE
jgi:hypothetical protein